MSKRRRGRGEVIEQALADACAGDLVAILFLQVCAPDVAETLRQIHQQPHRRATTTRDEVRVMELTPMG